MFPCLHIVSDLCVTRTEKSLCLCRLEVCAANQPENGNPMVQRALVVWMLPASSGEPANQGGKLQHKTAPVASFQENSKQWDRELQGLQKPDEIQQLSV